MREHLSQRSAALSRWCVGWPLHDLLCFGCFLVKVLMAVHFWAGMLSASLFVNDLSYRGWMKLESFGEGLVAFPDWWAVTTFFLMFSAVFFPLGIVDLCALRLGTTVVWLLKPFPKDVSFWLVCLIDYLSTHMCFTWVCYLLDSTSVAGIHMLLHTLWSHVLHSLLASHSSLRNKCMKLNVTFHIQKLVMIKSG